MFFRTSVASMETVHFRNSGMEHLMIFLERHGLDMGIAHRQDFRSDIEWKQWKGRKSL